MPLRPPTISIGCQDFAILTRPRHRSQLRLLDSRRPLMSKAQPKPSPTDEHARRIARAIAKGRPPPFSAELDRYCESCPREIFAAFTGAARHMPPAGNDEVLA